MTKKKIIATLIASLFSILAYAAKPLATSPQSSPGTQATNPISAREKTAGEALKNIQVLKDVPVSNLIPTMQFISGSLGVSCEFCHQVGKFEKDVKKPKQTARSMITMTRAINEANFGGKQKVTCNTCHQGNIHPGGIPHTWEKTPEQAAEYRKELAAVTPPGTESPFSALSATPPAPAEPVAPLPDVDKVLADYRRAVGAPIRSIHMVGTVRVDYLISTTPVEVDAVYPDKFFSQTPFAGQQIMNGSHGWFVTAQRKIDLTPGQLQGTRDTMRLLAAAVKISDAAVPRKVVGTEKIGGHTLYVVESKLPNQTDKSYFDVGTGLLYKTRTESPTALGILVTEVVFEDYRDIGGARLPYKISLLFLEDNFIYQFSEIQTNITVDPAKFEPPAAAPPLVPK
ncbi:MAG TPA: c-type cytochrome [Candidatus Acidoferrum sp.]|jgi:hypothetical protein